MSAPPPKTYNTPLIEPKSQPTRYLYRPHDGFELGGCHADVYLPTEEPTKDGGWPVALAIHGGSFAMFGARQIPAHQIDHLTTRGIAVVSIEYRLAPHCTIQDQIEDCCFAYDWIRTSLNGILDQHRVDPDKVLVFGASAGGYLALMVAQQVSPPPLAVTAYYAVTDWTTLALNEDREAWKKGRSDEEIAYINQVFEGPGLTSWTDGYLDNPPPARMAYVRAISATGCIFARLLPPSAQATDSTRSSLSPLKLATSSFPPTCLVVPSSDTLVPPSQSYTLGDRLKALGVECHVSVVADAPHGFEWHAGEERFEAGTGSWWKSAEEGVAFLAAHV